MWSTILTVLLPVAAKIILMFLDKSQADEKLKEDFLEFIKKMEPHSKSCIRIREDYEAQRDAILKKRQEEKQ